MEQFIIYLVIFLIVGGIQVIKAMNKDKNAPAKGKVKQFNRNPSPNPPQSQREIYKQLGLEDLYEQLQNKKPAGEKQAAQPKAKDELTLREQRKIREAQAQKQKEAEEARKEAELRKNQHFAEQNVIREIETAHAQGKEFEHHTHNYLSEGEDIYKKSFEADLNKTEGKVVRKEHPLKKALTNSRDLRNAIVMKEIFDKKY
ncbi:MAG: hypothetical protein H6581_01650 [Bacteroidia bacterium]|nr:hypothetical protein [Bacteroidia bacterium]